MTYVIMSDKPSLEAMYIAHYDVSGMKWGRRKARAVADAGGRAGSRIKRGATGSSTKQRVAVGAAFVAAFAATNATAFAGNRNAVVVGSAVGLLAKYGGRPQSGSSTP